VEVYPIYITEYGKANWVSGTAKGEEIWRKMREVSGVGEIEEGRLVIREK
jgi:hypothetical protein